MCSACSFFFLLMCYHFWFTFHGNVNGLFTLEAYSRKKFQICATFFASRKNRHVLFFPIVAVFLLLLFSSVFSIVSCLAPKSYRFFLNTRAKAHWRCFHLPQAETSRKKIVCTEKVYEVHHSETRLGISSISFVTTFNKADEFLFLRKKKSNFVE